MTIMILAIVFVISLAFVLGLHTFDKVDTEIEIDGSVDDVWKTLTNFQDYPEWNPFLTQVSGEFKSGSNVEATFALPFSKSASLNLEIQDVKKKKGFSFVSKLLEPKIFDTTHYLQIEKIKGGNVKFSQGEKFSGLLLYIIAPLIKGSIENNFEKMNLALKNKVEGVVVTNDDSPVPSSA